MTITGFRIQYADRDVNELLDPDHQFSSSYNRVARNTRRGVSVCRTLEELAEYLASGAASAIQPRSDGSWVIVCLSGPESPDAPLDPYEALIMPETIVSVRPLDLDFMDMIEERAEFLAGMEPIYEFDD